MKLASGGQEQVQFEHALLATGSVPAIPPMLKVDDARVMDSTGALDLPDIPKTLLVVGGGYIGLELGTVYATLGSAVTVVEMTPGLLPGADRDLVDILAKRVAQTMKSVLLQTKVVQVKPDAKGVRVMFEGNADKTEQQFDRVLVSVGRRPNSKIPGLDKTRLARLRSTALLHPGPRLPQALDCFASERGRDVVGETLHRRRRGARACGVA